MAPTIARTVVDRPAAEVFGYATDPARFREWQQGLIDAHLDPPGPAQVGAKCVTTRRIGGASRVVTSELTHIDAPRTWGVRGTDGPIRATVNITVEPATETSSRLSIAVDFHGYGIGRLLVPLTRMRCSAPAGGPGRCGQGGTRPPPAPPGLPPRTRFRPRSRRRRTPCVRGDLRMDVGVSW